MKQELIYISKVKFVRLTEYTGEKYFGGNFPDKIFRKVENIERIGKPFSVITEHLFENNQSIHYQPELIFKDLMIRTSLEKYLNEAEIEFSWRDSKNKKTQYLGLIHGKPTKISSSAKINEEYSIGMEKCILPCHFYLIKDKFK